MRFIITPIVMRLLRTVLHALAGALAVGIVVLVYVLDARPDLSVWHLTHLDAEYTVDSDVADFADYLSLEERLFKQLDSEILAKVTPAREHSLNRFSRGSLADPARWPGNWNRSYILHADKPVAKALLLHGLSDSPYSLRVLAETLHKRGVTVLGLRVPGHGTAPSGLLRTRWQDMAAAVRLAARHLGDIAKDQPLYLVGYSNGGALAVEYALSTLEEPDLPKAAGLVLGLLIFHIRRCCP